ncbi:MAG TPA: hypothetical protein VNK26_06390 [Pyrinomonadaceae bacterium]|nr:hypothetical protein [Pyrinomonadaceae bacterium]
MNTSNTTLSARSKITFFIITLLLLSIAVNAQKMTAEEVVKQHLDSLASPETRAKLKNQLILGEVVYKVLRQGGVGGNGKIVFASEDGKALAGMSFGIPSYPSETIVNDGSQVKIAFIQSNTRSYIGDFLFRFPELIREGLFGGVLTTNWPLLSNDRRGAKLDFEGKKKLDGKEVYVLSYYKKGGSDLSIKLYFDAGNFHHIRSEYRRIFSSQIGSISGAAPGSGAAAADASSSQREIRQILIEDFGDFKTEAGITLPHTWRAYLSLDGAAGTREYEWRAQFNNFFINQPIDKSVFETQGK